MASDRHAEDQRRRVDIVLPGWFKLRLTKGGWQVPCRIGYEGETGWYAVIDGFSHQPNPDPWLAEGVSDVHAYGHKISHTEYEDLLSLKVWAGIHARNHPALWPHRRIDPMQLRPLFPRTQPQWTPTP
jgi:hypothetical protein